MRIIRLGVVSVTQRGRLRPGETVEVRAPAEILATLDTHASLDAMPFMPEMLEHVGKRFTVSRRVEKICDTVQGESASRRVPSTVYLEDLRCDGSAHDGCQLGCRIYWKEEWLRSVDGGEKREAVDRGIEALASVARSGARTIRELDGKSVKSYRCQATEAYAASEMLNKYDLRQYVREVTSGNVGPLHVLWVLGRAVCFKALRMLRLRRMLPLALSNGQEAEAAVGSGLVPGDVVQVKSRQEVSATLNPHGRNRGLSFDPEMVPYCGGTYRVKDRVKRFIEEKTGQMVELESDCLILEGVTCRAEHGTFGFMFCPRAVYPFWRETWLRRVVPENESSSQLTA